LPRDKRNASAVRLGRRRSSDHDGEGSEPNLPGRRPITLVITATSYPFLNILWTTLIFFAWVIFIWIAITVLIDVFRRHDISGWGKAAWVIFVVIIPWIGVLVYLIANHDGMAERRMKEAQASQAQFDEYVRQSAGTGGAAAEIEKAKQLLDSGAITQAEFDALKAKALA
jgi:Short C-terminal domain/Phospholipase_D-nuclease N-terminal